MVNKAKIGEIRSETRAFSPITGLEDVDQEADEVKLPRLTRDDLTSLPMSDDENCRHPHPYSMRKGGSGIKLHCI